MSKTNKGRGPKSLQELISMPLRVKSISALPFSTPRTSQSPANYTVLLTSVSSDGHVNLYDLDAVHPIGAPKEVIQPIASYDTKGTRLTCVFLADGRADAGRNVNDASLTVKQEAGGGAQVDSDEEDDEEEEEEEDMYELESAEEAVGDDDDVEVEIED